MYFDNSITRTCNDRPLEVNLRVLHPDGSLFQLPANVDNRRQWRDFAPLPVGWCDRACPKCCSKELIGALISDSADRMDPDVLCTCCGYYF